MLADVQMRIEAIPEKKLIGMFIEMSIQDNKTFSLFRTFMPRKKEIQQVLNKDVLDLIVYPTDYFKQFDPTKSYKKWALVEVADFENIPKGMTPFTLAAGQYAVFTHKPAHTGETIFPYIYTQWLPSSAYLLEDRPHFDILNEKIQQRDPEADAEVWIPVKRK